MTTLTLPSATTLTDDLGHPDPLRIAAAFLTGYGDATRDAYWRDLRHYAAWCTTMQLDVLQAQRVHIDLYARHLTDDYSPSTIARRLSTLAGYYRYACDEGILDRNPVERVRRPKVPDTSPRSGLERAEAAAMLHTADTPRDLAVIGLLMLDGLRASEVGALDVADLQDDRGHRVLQVPGKGGRLDTVPLVPQVADAIDRHLEGRDNAAIPIRPDVTPLILGNDGARLNRHRVARIVTRIARAAGIDRKVCPHDLRHAFVTHALGAGAPLHRVQQGARHADPRTTQRYNRAKDQLDGHATYTLAAYLGDAA
jgi:integrase/recombinase XerD